MEPAKVFVCHSVSETRAAAIEEASELPSWGVKQKPITSRSPWTVTVGLDRGRVGQPGRATELGFVLAPA